MAAAEWTLDQTFDYHGDAVRYRVIGSGPDLVLVPGSQYRTIPGSGHLMQEDAPEAVVAAIYDFGR